MSNIVLSTELFACNRKTNNAIYIETTLFDVYSIKKKSCSETIYRVNGETTYIYRI